MIEKEQREAFIELANYAKEDSSIEEIWLISVKGEYGLLYVDTYSEELDNHCQQCIDELLAFGLGHEVLGRWIGMNVGRSKFARIQNGTLQMAGHEVHLLERLI